jgi:hypothetical protein
MEKISQKVYLTIKNYCDNSLTEKHFLASQIIYDPINNTILEIDFDEDGTEVFRNHIDDSENFEYITPDSSEFVKAMHGSVQIEKTDNGYIQKDVNENGILLKSKSVIKNQIGLVERTEEFNSNNELINKEEWWYDKFDQVVGNRITDSNNNVIEERTLEYDHNHRIKKIIILFYNEEKMLSEKIYDYVYD